MCTQWRREGTDNEPEMGECLQLGDSPAYQQLKGLQVYFVPFSLNPTLKRESISADQSAKNQRATYRISRIILTVAVI